MISRSYNESIASGLGMYYLRRQIEPDIPPAASLAFKIRFALQVAEGRVSREKIAIARQLLRQNGDTPAMLAFLQNLR